MFFAIFAAIGFFAILWDLVLPVLITGFNSKISKELALEMLKLMVNVGLGLIAADLGLVSWSMYVGHKKASLASAEPRRSREVGLVASVTFVFLVLSILAVLASISYLGEYATRGSFVWPLLFMVCGMAGVFYLLYLSAAQQGT